MQSKKIELVNAELQEQEQEPEVAMPDRRGRDSPWSDPILWVTVCGILLTIFIAILSFIWAQLASINAALEGARTEQRLTRDAVLVVTTRQEADSRSIDDRVKKLENAMDTQSKAYNFNFTTRLAAIEAKIGFKQQQEEGK